MTTIKAGDLVRMSPRLKAQMRGDCTPTKHVKEYDPDTGDCIACSTAHVEEFGGCTGIVEDPIWPDHPEHEWNVRWQPSKLRYGYKLEDLIKVRG